MADYLPAELRYLLTDGVTMLGRDVLDTDTWVVRVRQSGRQHGQWVGTYESSADAWKVATRLRDAIPGALVGNLTGGYLVTTMLPAIPAAAMSAVEFRSILESVGYGEDDLARHLSKSRSIIQKMKAGAAPVHPDTAAAMETLQDAYADARDTLLDAAPAEITVPRTDEESWATTGRPARWHRMIAAACRQEHGTRIVWTGDESLT